MINSKELPMILRITQKPNISDVIKPTIKIESLFRISYIRCDNRKVIGIRTKIIYLGRIIGLNIKPYNNGII